LTSGEYWRAFTALFAHADIAHFLSNGWLLFLFGWFLRDFAGRWAFPVLSFLIGILTNIITVMTMHPQTYLIGASGMVYGMIGMWLVIYMWHADVSLGKRILRTLGFAMLMLIPSTFRPEVSYAAHGIGFALGLGFAVPFCFFRVGMPEMTATDRYASKNSLYLDS
jgi:rhomboid protease GluP